MELKIGSIVKSGAGHDKGDLLVVCGVSENRVSVIDGKARRIESPKSKNQKHLSYISMCEEKICEKLSAGEKIPAADIRKILSLAAADKQL